MAQITWGDYYRYMAELKTAVNSYNDIIAFRFRILEAVKHCEGIEDLAALSCKLMSIYHATTNLTQILDAERFITKSI